MFDRPSHLRHRHYAALRRGFSHLRDVTLAMLYPATCRICGAPVESWRDGIACGSCWEDAEQRLVPENLCAKCGVLLPSMPATFQPSARTCGRCAGLAFDFARACSVYDGAVRESVLRLKMQPHMSPRLRTLLRQTFEANKAFHACQSLIPVPLHEDRFKERTFNQAEVIAEALAAVTGLRVDVASVVRVKKTQKHRAGMSGQDRAKSLEKAFRIRAPRLIAGKTVLVIDDVMTTASTAQEMAQTLRDGGACGINVLTLARTGSEFLG